MWLYQMSAGSWDERQYRLRIWEGETVYWPVGKAKGEARPKPGDILICWYAVAKGESPGLCGWGVVVAYNEEDITGKLAWRPTPPSDELKMRPLVGDQLKARIDKIRGSMPRGTLWPIERRDAAWISEHIQKRLGE